VTDRHGNDSAGRRAVLAVLGLGFRPFYLLAGLFAVVAVPLWVAAYTGMLSIDGYLAGFAWHQHEMLFGFAVAVIAGFLLTAVRNWTGCATPTGFGLGSLAALWILARVLAFTGPAIPAMLIDLAFLPVLAAMLAVPILRSENSRNIKLIFVLIALAAANTVYHLSYSGVLPARLNPVSVNAALDVIVILIAIMSGRVIPAFTANAIPAASPRRETALEVVAIGALLLILLADMLSSMQPLPAVAWATLYFIAAAAHGVRLWLWEPHRTFRNTLLLMLPLAYAWIPLMLALRGLAAMGLLPATAAVHALTIGAMASLMLAMMMRSALGHTGRELIASRSDFSAFVLLQFAAVLRVTATIAGAANYRILLEMSAALWVLSFIVFLFRYAPMLVRARIDGRPG
tara:strand:- start:941 stop:2143 length:1203 start_codon:yes stop_codon:yes gene_type:complete